MRSIRATRLVLAASALFAAGTACAQSCGGFTDVLVSDSFCAEVLWLKNRQVTLGCTTTEYVLTRR